ncbi:MAG: GAF domain-containing protein [Bacillota bacterium]|nr:GAF domain-containing protein [Bacillota bacterium]
MAGIYWPINKGASTVGVFVLTATNSHQLSDSEQKLLSSLAEMAGTAIHRLSLFEDTVKQLQQLHSLRSIDKTISSSLDQKLTMNILLEHVVAQANVEGAAIYLLHPHLKELEYAVSRGVDSSFLEEVYLKLGGTAAGKAVLERRIIMVPDKAGHLDPICVALLKATNYRGCINLPLIAKGDVKGVLVVFHNLNVKPEKDWLDFLEILAGQASISIDSAVVDVYDALISDRLYRKAWSREEAVEHIKKESGKHFDSQVVVEFLKEI